MSKRSSVFATTAIMLVCAAVRLDAVESGTPRNTSVERIVFVGDSITCGVGAGNASNRYSTVTTRLLKERFPGIIEVNCGQSGRALCQQRGDDYAATILKQNPDAVVVQWGVNDQYWSFSVARFAACYDRFVSSLRAAKPAMPIVLCTLIADFRWPENSDLWISEANVAIQEIAALHHCRVADLHRAINHDKKFYADVIHPNAAGAKVMAQVIASVFDAPSAVRSPAEVQFDQGTEVRFLQYTFTPRRQGVEPVWIRISEITPTGMRIETAVPLSVRTAPSVPKGARPTARDKAGAEVALKDSRESYGGFCTFTLDPSHHEGPFTITIDVPKTK